MSEAYNKVGGKPGRSTVLYELAHRGINKWHFQTGQGQKTANPLPQILMVPQV